MEVAASSVPAAPHPTGLRPATLPTRGRDKKTTLRPSPNCLVLQKPHCFGDGSNAGAGFDETRRE